ncbi:helix-turn-helix transcriptional regulator [Paracoccus sp. MBLB3053]|uniref:Helix-turn-helix transcriptional regulator n=1 Tax=Paracoccus aurantius TaxID=3073814 RepID=A0ABU2HVP4_9RHOB|nr:helix-turn-helix transcriptional regulator [Paracoccus sp. MBLB3053]MDS9468620.1 helix-turn-helix transcriptional regulator [Paracoccus sp. MBLB3053]
MRELSRQAGTGPNYVQQMIKDRKEPGADRLARLLDVLGTEHALFILTGVQASPEDLELLALLNTIPDHVKTQIRPLLTAMQASESEAKQGASDSATN